MISLSIVTRLRLRLLEKSATKRKTTTTIKIFIIGMLAAISNPAESLQAEFDPPHRQAELRGAITCSLPLSYAQI